MPILPEDNSFLPIGALPALDYLGPEDTAEAFPGVFATVKAAAQRSNWIGSAVSNQMVGIDRTAKEDGFSGETLWQEIQGTKYESRWQSFADIHNRTAFEAMKSQLDTEDENNRTLEAAGWVGTGADMLAQIIDLPTLLPGGAIIRGAGIGASAARTALSTAVAGGLAAGVSEFGLHATQETRTLEESLMSVGGAALLSGVLGAGVGAYFSKAERSAALQAVERAKGPEFDAATDVLHQELTDISLGAQSAGAAAARVDSLDDLSIAGGAASKVAKTTAQLNPLLRTLHSPSVAVRTIASRMMDTPVYLKKNLRGEGDTAAETAMYEYTRGGVVQALEKQRAAFSEARKGGLNLSEQEFREAVGRAMRRNDDSDIPGVSAAAKAWRAHVIEPLKQRAIENGMLPADVSVKTADSYFTRIYNRPLIEANEADFKSIVRGWVSGALDQEIRRTNARADARLLSLQTEINHMETGILRRGEFMRRREQGLEIDPTEFDESEIVSLVRRVQAGEKPEQVEGLSQWLKRQKGGIFDPTGELAAVFPDARTIPGLLRKTRRTDINSRGGDGLDDIVLRAWEEGFLNDAGAVRMGIRDTVAERPSIREFLEALDADLRGERVVRHSDMEKARAADDFDRVLRALDRAGVDFERPLFGTSDDMLGLASRVNRVLDDLDREQIGRLRASADAQNARKLGDFLSDADRDGYLDEIVEDIYAKVTGRIYDGEVPTNIAVAARGPLKERTFNIPDELIEKYLDSDAEMIGRHYARVMAADIELAERFGSPDMKDAFVDVAADYNKLRDRISRDESLDGAGRQKALQKLAAREKADIRDLEGVRDLLRGHYRPEIQHTTWARIGRAANTFNYVRAMGGVLVASLTDAVRPAMVHGLKAYMQDGIAPLIKNASAVKMSVQEAKLAGAISERILAGRLATMAEITDPYALNSPFERLLENAGVGFSRLTGLLHWNDFQKSLTSVITQNRILKNAEIAARKGFDALPDAEKAYMGLLGIGQGRAEDIGKLFAAHGETLDGVRVANSNSWGDDPIASVLRRAYRAAVNKDVDSVIVTKGVGDVPLMANTPLGRSLLQFKSFAIASNQRVLIRGLQEDKARFVGGMIGMSTVGMFIYMLKQLESGRPISSNPGTWIAEGLDRSGIFSVAFEINNALEKAGAPGVYTAASALGTLVNPEADMMQPASRYAVRSTVGGFLGPSFGAATDAVNLTALGFSNMRSIAQGEGGTISSGDIQAIRRLTPFASLPYWRWAIDGFLVPKVKEATGN